MKDINLLTSNGVDVNHGLELLGDMDMYNSVIKEFLACYDERMKRIANYKNNSDMANYAIEVHSLKSDSKYLGFMTLADLAYKHEMASKAGDINSVVLHYDELVVEANRIIQVVKLYLDGDNVSAPPTIEADNTPDNNVVMISKEEVELSTKAILVADDSSIIRDFVKEIFSNQYEVLMAKDGQEVINIISADPKRIAALLLDLNMPNVDGFGVLDYLKENNLFTIVPTSIISGASDKESIEKAFKYPIVDMLNKPFSRDNVKLVVEKTVGISSM